MQLFYSTNNLISLAISGYILASASKALLLWLLVPAILSSVLTRLCPLFSGMLADPYTIKTSITPAYIQKVPANPSSSRKEGYSFVAPNWLTAVIEPQRPEEYDLRRKLISQIIVSNKTV